ncbi:MAG: DUF3558 family protein [Pseudonocardiales bacterium]
MNRRYHLYLASLVPVLALAGYLLLQAFIPAGAPEPLVPPSSPVSPPSGTSPKTGKTGLVTIEVCDLLTRPEASSLGVPSQGRPDDIASLRSCTWTTPEGAVSTAINEDLGIDGLNLTDASSVTDITIGRYQAKRAVETSGPGYCDIYFAVGDNANVAVTALYLNDTPRACAAVDRAAALVEPKLP